MEVCIENIKSAVAAAQGGASRLELCSALSEGGLTPSIGQLRVIKQLVSIPVFVMLRPRSGNFVYDEHDKQCMKEDAREFQNQGADGFVFGALTRDGNIDVEFCKEMIKIIGSKPVTFHRAFDWTFNPDQALEEIISLGFTRVLTSGLETTAFQGVEMLKNLIVQAKERILVMPGAGINLNNLKEILSVTKAKEFHASARVSEGVSGVFSNPKCNMGTQDTVEMFTDVQVVKKMLRIYTEVNGK